ncbi:MAG: hypothetical protein ACREFU_22030 [Acetobacteraceae bacterium]
MQSGITYWKAGVAIAAGEVLVERAGLLPRTVAPGSVVPGPGAIEAGSGPARVALRKPAGWPE